MKKTVQLIVVFSSILLSDNLLSEVQKNGLVITNTMGKKIKLERNQDPKCSRANLNPEALWSGDYASKKVADVCKKTFVTHVGILQPMDLGKGIKTVGELEVLVHIKKAQDRPTGYILIDARTPRWFEQMSIPSSVNLPFNEMDYDEDKDEDDFESEDEYEEYVEQYTKMFALLNIQKSKKGLDFSKAKSVILFCNGSWCSQSPKAIFKLLNMGYPKEKLLWYRGGLQDWLIYDFTVEKSNP
jgi:rhodanese-related sulfurtransferase